jgi:signal transduction histidine kinase
MTTTSSLPRTTGVRVKLAVGIALATLLVVAVVAVTATAFSAWQEPDSSEPRVGVAQVDGEIVVLVAEDDPAAVDGARTATLRWSLVALGLSVIPAVAVGWIVAGSMLGTVDNALAELEAAEQERDRKLQEVVHELRTPLAVMGTNLELAAADPGADPESAVFIDAARRALDRMDRTIDDLAGHGGLVVDAAHEAADIAAVAAGIVEEFSGPAHNRGIHLAIRGSGTLAAGSAERAPLRTALGNLMANAVRLAPRGSKVMVDWGTVPGWAWVAVTDEGPGLPPSDHSRVFERGWRGPHERHRDTGAGLGLTIARQLTEAQGGRLTVTSQEGAGSTFTVWMPTAPDADMQTVVAEDGVHPAVAPWEHGSVPV